MKIIDTRKPGRAVLALILFLLAAVLLSGCASVEARAARRGDLAAVKEYIESGGNVNERQKGGMTLLMYASVGGQVTTMEYLLNVGADIAMKDDKGYTALIHGASSNRENSLSFLLDSGADINARSGRGETSLFIAASKDYFRIVGALLNRGADYTIPENSGRTPILASLYQSALQSSGINQSSELLFSAGADFSAQSGTVSDIAFKAAESGNEQVLDLLFGKGLSPGIRDTGGNSLLHAGAVHFRVVRELLGRGVNVNNPNNSGETPLILAVRRGAEKSAALMIDAGANTEARDAGNKTALLYAAAGQNTEILRKLLLAGSNVFVTDEAGNTALHTAASRGVTESVRLLLTAGIFVDAANKEGQTPYNVSFRNEQYGSPIREVLAAAGAVVPEVPAESVKPAAPVPPAPSVPTAASPSVQTASDDMTASPEASAPSVSSAAAESPQESEFNLRFSWPKITPSKVKGWNNSDKITQEATLTLQYSEGGNPLLSENILVPLKGVNAEAFSFDRSVVLRSGSRIDAVLSIPTEKGNHLISRRSLDVSSGQILDCQFMTFEYLQ